MGIPHPSSGTALQSQRAQRERRKKQSRGSTCCRLHGFWSRQAVLTLPLLPLLPRKPLSHHGHLLEPFLPPLAGISRSASLPPVWPLPETPSSTPVCSLGPSTAPGMQGLAVHLDAGVCGPHLLVCPGKLGSVRS